MNWRGSKVANAFFLIICALSFIWCVYRDVQIRTLYPGDLRNRVVGARMQMDGKSPYFYHWKEGDDPRYYDWNNPWSGFKISNVTATPFFHQIISPISSFSQYTISWIWLAFHYTAFFIMLILAIRLCTSKEQKMLVIAAGIGFLYTYAWMNSIYSGQMYFIIALLSFAFYYVLNRKQTLFNAGVAGLLAVALILIRPTTIVYLMPFLLLAHHYKLRYKVALVASSLFLLGIAFGNSSSRQYWADYRMAVTDHVKMHQRLNPATMDSVYLPTLPENEGWEIRKIPATEKTPFYTHNDAHSNLFVIVNNLSTWKAPMWVITALWFAAMSLAVILTWSANKSLEGLNIYSVAIFGYFLYMITDISSPVHRFHYYAIQWMFPLLLTASSWKPSVKHLPAAGVVLGLFFNSLTVRLFPMQPVIGEYLLGLSLFVLFLLYRKELAHPKTNLAT